MLRESGSFLKLLSWNASFDLDLVDCTRMIIYVSSVRLFCMLHFAQQAFFALSFMAAGSNSSILVRFENSTVTIVSATFR